MSIDLATFSNGASGSSVRTTLNTLITRFTDVLNVKDFGATGDGSTDDTTSIQTCLDTAYGTTGSPHGTTATSNKSVFFPPGDYKTTSALTLRSARGANIFGAGRFTTKIHNVTSNGNVFTTNGCEYSSFEKMYLVSNGTGAAFDLDWDNTGSTALQSNTFRDMYFEGGAYGLRIGNTGFMGSENLIQNCYFAGFTTAGLAPKNFNALANTVIGGNFASCAIGIWVAAGSCPTIHGVSFQNQSDADIAIDNSANDTYSIMGCRNENSLNNTTFVRRHAGAATYIAGCNHLASGTGTVFLYAEAGPPPAGTGAVCIDSCYSTGGKITGNGTIYIRGNAGGIAFGNASYLSTFAGTVVQNI